MKKILYLMDNDIDTIGGSQKSAKTIIYEMLQLNYEVGIFMPNNKDTLRDPVLKEKCKLYTIDEKNKKSMYEYLFYRIKKLYKAIKEYEPDIIHAQNAQAGILLGILKKFRLINKNIKCIFTDRGFLSGYGKKYQIAFKFIGKSFDNVITTTDINKKEWLEYAHIDANRIYCIKNVLDNEWFDFSEETKLKLKEKYGVTNRFTIGFAGRFDECKRWDTVMEICKKMKKNSNVMFAIAMTADTEELEREMDKYLEEMKNILDDQLIVMKNVGQAQMQDFYYILDAFVLTSYKESFGRTLLEAMTKNNIVLGTNSGGVPDVIKKKEFLFEVGDYNRACEMLEEYIDDYEKTEKTKGYFLDYVKTNFSVAELRKKHEMLYEQE